MGVRFLYVHFGAGDTNIQTVADVLDNGPETGVPSVAYNDHRLRGKGRLLARLPCFPRWW